MGSMGDLYADLLVGLWSSVEEQRVQEGNPNLTTITEEELRSTLARIEGYEEKFFRTSCLL